MLAKELKASANNMHYCNYKQAICPDCDPFDPDCEVCSLENERADVANHKMKEVS